MSLWSHPHYNTKQQNNVFHSHEQIKNEFVMSGMPHKPRMMQMLFFLVSIRLRHSSCSAVKPNSARNFTTTCLHLSHNLLSNFRIFQ